MRIDGLQGVVLGLKKKVGQWDDKTSFFKTFSLIMDYKTSFKNPTFCVPLSHFTLCTTFYNF